MRQSVIDRATRSGGQRGGQRAGLLVGLRVGLVVLLWLGSGAVVWGINDPINPDGSAGKTDLDGKKTKTKTGGYYETETQVFHEDVGVVGAPFGLHYSSRRVSGYGPGQTVCVRAVGEAAPGLELPVISVGVVVAPDSGGLQAGWPEPGLPPGVTNVVREPGSQSLLFMIRPQVSVMWPQAVLVGVIYRVRMPSGGSGGGGGPGGVIHASNISFHELIYTNVRQAVMGVAGTQASGLGGWTPDIQHVYCPAERTLYGGDGSLEGVEGPVEAAGGVYRVASPGGDEVYEFSQGGRRHERTLDRLTGAVKYGFGYDGAGRLIEVSDGAGRVTAIERDSSGVALGIVGPDGQRTALTVTGNSAVDGGGWLTQVVNPAGETNVMAYTGNGLLTSIRSRRGDEFRMGYDGEGRLAQVEVPGEGTQTLTQVRLTRDDGAEETDFGIWEETFVVGIKRRETASLSAAQRGDPARYAVRVRTGEGRVREYAVEQSVAGVNRFRQWDGEALWTGGVTPVLERRVDPRNAGTNTYANGMREAVGTGPDPEYGWQAPVVTQVVVSTPGGLSMVVDRTVTATGGDWAVQARLNGKSYAASYTASNRVLTSVTPEGRRGWTTLDATGRVVRVEQPGLYPVTVSYDPEGRPIRVEQGAGPVSRIVEWGYGADGFVNALTNGLGEAVQLSRDAVGRATNVVFADERRLGLRYDRSEQPVGVTPPARAEHALSYTPVGELSGYQPPAETNGALAWTYNRDRQVRSVVRPDGGVITNDYDAAGRLSRVAWPGGSASVSRDAAQRVVEISGQDGGGVEYGWDGGLPLMERWVGVVTGTVSRTYDNDFRVQALTVGGSAALGYEYDLDGAVTRAGDLSVYRDRDTGLVTNTLLGSVSETVAFNGFGEVAHREAAAGSAGLYVADYGFDALGRVTNLVEVVGGETNRAVYRYDAGGRLVGVAGVDSSGSYENAYAFDANGNRTQAVVCGVTAAGTVDGQDRLLSQGGVTYQHDAAGTLTNRIDPSGQGTGYRYDARGVLLGVTRHDAQGVEYRVDALGRRIGKRLSSTGAEKRWLYANALKPVAELDGSNRVVSVFVYGTGGLTPDYLVKAGVRYRIVADRLGSPRLVVNAETGAIVQRMDYDEWGRVTRDTNPGFQPFGFAGGHYDPDTGLVRFGLRDYDPETGRWTAKDPILFAGGDANLYVYCANDPVNFVDPWGLCEKKPGWPSQGGNNTVNKVKGKIPYKSPFIPTTYYTVPSANSAPVKPQPSWQAPSPQQEPIWGDVPEIQAAPIAIVGAGVIAAAGSVEAAATTLQNPSAVVAVTEFIFAFNTPPTGGSTANWAGNLASAIKDALGL